MIGISKRKRNLNYEKFIKEGRGQGIGEKYLPWIKIQDMASKGRSTRLKGIKTNRQHKFLSDLERDYFYYLEFCDDVIDIIREQYPLLPLEETLDIAEQLGIKHPLQPYSDEGFIMSTDFLITKRENGTFINLARTVKYKDNLMDKRISEKFEIERIFWERRG